MGDFVLCGTEDKIVGFTVMQPMMAWNFQVLVTKNNGSSTLEDIEFRI